MRFKVDEFIESFKLRAEVKSSRRFLIRNIMPLLVLLTLSLTSINVLLLKDIKLVDTIPVILMLVATLVFLIAPFYKEIVRLGLKFLKVPNGIVFSSFKSLEKVCNFSLLLIPESGISSNILKTVKGEMKDLVLVNQLLSEVTRRNMYLFYDSMIEDSVRDYSRTNNELFRYQVEKLIGGDGYRAVQVSDTFTKPTRGKYKSFIYLYATMDGCKNLVSPELYKEIEKEVSDHDSYCPVVFLTGESMESLKYDGSLFVRNKVLDVKRPIYDLQALPHDFKYTILTELSSKEAPDEYYDIISNDKSEYIEYGSVVGSYGRVPLVTAKCPDNLQSVMEKFDSVTKGIVVAANDNGVYTTEGKVIEMNGRYMNSIDKFISAIKNGDMVLSNVYSYIIARLGIANLLGLAPLVLMMSTISFDRWISLPIGLIYLVIIEVLCSVILMDSSSYGSTFHTSSEGVRASIMS